MIDANLQRISAGMARAKPLELLKTPAGEEDVETRQHESGANRAAASGPESHNEDRSEIETRAAIDHCRRAAEVMKALFPDGVQLKSDQQFAVFRLFDGLVGHIAQFAQSGMAQRASIRAISLQSSLLDHVISSNEQH